jgi:hypothetical protein
VAALDTDERADIDERVAKLSGTLEKIAERGQRCQISADELEVDFPV